MPGSSGRCKTNILRNCQSISQSGCTTLHAHQQWRRAAMSLPLHRHSAHCQSFDFNLPGGCIVASQYDCSLHFPDDVCCYHFLHIFFGKVFMQAFHIFLIGLFVFSWLNSLTVLNKTQCKVFQMPFSIYRDDHLICVRGSTDIVTFLIMQSLCIAAINTR